MSEIMSQTVTIPATAKLKKSSYAAWSFLTGVAKDFWKDGHWEIEDDFDTIIHEKPEPVAVKPEIPKPAEITEEPEKYLDPDVKFPWKAADRIELLEKIWGEQQLLPMDTEITETLLKPLNLDSNDRVLDLAAGLGARMRRATALFGVYIAGKEPNPEIAKRGMQIMVKTGLAKKLTIDAYDPNNLKDERPYNCIMFREILCNVQDKAKFIKTLSEYCKPNAQIAFTDFILVNRMHGAKLLEELGHFEAGFSPMTLKELSPMLSERGFVLRISEDLTDQYKEAVQNGLLQFIKFLKSAELDEKTKELISQEITFISKRLEALEKDIKFYRFYGTKN